MRPTQILTTCTLLCATLLTGCITADSANVYKKNEMRQVATARAGVIENIRDVQMDGSNTAIGSIAGAVIGGVAASSNIGNGSGAVISGVLGSILGGMLGNQIESQITRKAAKELTIVMSDNGQRLVVAQDADVNFVIGQHVDVITDGQTARVIPSAAKPVKASN